MTWETPIFIAALWLGSLFVYSASLKLLEPVAHTVSAVQGYGVLPPDTSRVVGVALPYAELAVGVLILLTPYGRLGFGAAAVLG